MEHELTAPIATVVVHPEGARITRRGTVRLGAGRSAVALAGLPLELDRDSVRVAGRGAARVRGVDVDIARRAAEPEAERRGALLSARRAVEERIAETEDAVTVADRQVGLLTVAGARAGKAVAKAMAGGHADATRLHSVSSALRDGLATVLAELRGLARTRRELVEERDRIDRDLSDVGPQSPDRIVVTVDLESAADDAQVELEVSYAVWSATWRPHYDLRLEGERLAVDWFGTVSQSSGEDWPACELTLSTARTTVATQVPELDPWFLREHVPVPVPTRSRSAMPAAAMTVGAGEAWARADEVLAAAPELDVETARVEHGITASAYRVRRPAPVAGDGGEHQVLVTTFELPARLDHVTAPVVSPDVVLRAVVTNDGEHTLMAGDAALHHGGDYVGTTDLEVWAPGEEQELALGVDDRIRVERKLIRRHAGTSWTGGVQRHEAAYRTTVANHSGRATRVTVLDQLPVSTSPQITVRDVRVVPAAAPTDLGEVAWHLELAPGEEAAVELGYRVDVAKGTRMAGWRD